MRTRALVLGGGGPVAVAWEAGLLAGFARGGVALAEADYVLGTSAGAIVGAQLTAGWPLDQVVEAIEAETGPPPGSSPPSAEALARLPQLFRSAQEGTGDPRAARAEIGAYALGAATRDEAEVVAMFQTFLPTGWPEREFACTAVDAGDGGFDLITGAHGAELARAVAASCALPGITPPVTVGARRYMDGGLRSATNADLAAGFDLVVIVAMGARGERGERLAAKLQREVESLQDGGTVVVTVTPDEAALDAIGPDPMDGARRPAAARAGLAQGQAQAGVLTEIWS